MAGSIHIIHVSSSFPPSSTSMTPTTPAHTHLQQPHPRQHLLHARTLVRVRHPPRQAEAGRELQRLADGQLRVEQVLLPHEHEAAAAAATVVPTVTGGHGAALPSPRGAVGGGGCLRGWDRGPFLLRDVHAAGQPHVRLGWMLGDRFGFWFCWIRRVGGRFPL